DFVGQQRVEQLARIVLISTTAISFVAGFATQSLAVTFGIFGAVTAVLALTIIPPWPVFKQHPVRWLAARK
ncbi:hypothetical protein AGABI1DRAFT_45167, partial [Agaricus bisporus var. burnettii JB137-S8]